MIYYVSHHTKGGPPGRARTSDIRFSRPAFYPTELQGVFGGLVGFSDGASTFVVFRLLSQFAPNSR